MSYQDIIRQASVVRNVLNFGDLDEEEFASETNELLALLEQPVTVWVMTITHEYGMDVRVFPSVQEAMDGVYRFVSDNWAQSCGYVKHYEGDEPLAEWFVPEMPTDKAAAISEYFATMQDSEDYDVVQAVIGM